jgi:hypothetical protein
MLNPTQILAAAELLKSRPPVLEGTRIIPGSSDRNRYYAQVTAVMRSTKVSDKDVNDFCDRAGVPD